MKRVGINIDGIAALRQMNDGQTPDPLHAIALLELAGVDGIVYTHNPSDPNSKRDLQVLRAATHTHFNMRITPDLASITVAKEARAEMVTLFEMRNGIISGVNIAEKEIPITAMVTELREAGIVVNILIPTDAQQIKSAAKVNCDYVDLYAEKMATAESLTLLEQEIENIHTMAMAARKLNLGVSISGPINFTNIRSILTIPEIEEINVGQAILARALFCGLDQAVRDFLHLVKS